MPLETILPEERVFMIGFRCTVDGELDDII